MTDLPNHSLTIYSNTRQRVKLGEMTGKSDETFTDVINTNKIAVMTSTLAYTFRFCLTSLLIQGPNYKNTL